MSFAPSGSAQSMDPSLPQYAFTPLPTHPSDPPSNLPAATPTTTSSQSTQEPANFRSCVTCRRRKVRCNKRSPCSNCIKGEIECIYPPPGRARRQTKRPQDAELMGRLKRLEGVIEKLSGKGTESTSSASNEPSPVARKDDPVPNEQPRKETSSCPRSLDFDPKNRTPNELTNGFGRLVIEEGRSRYVSNRLWTSLGDEIEELQDILDPSSSEDEDTPSPNSTLTRSSNHEEFLFGFHSISHSLRNYHPHAEKIPVFWDVYQENVAPLVTVLHKQIAKRRLMEAAQRPDAMDKNSEALIFAIYLITVVSMSSEECLEKLGESRDAAVKRYRFATEQALAKANFLNTQSLLLLQAAVMFLIGVRREDDTRFVWSMTSLVLRLAQGLGLHRDGTNFGLSPFETEMRRRLWWHICLLDIRSSEDHGTDFQICEKLYDTKLPLNVNDDDLFPDMKTPPSEHVGCTDMTFCLIRFEIITALRQVNGSSPNVRFHLDNPQLSPGHCGKMIQAINNRIEERYIQYCDMNNPLHWVCATVARVILAKLWLIVHHPMARRNLELNLTHASRESLFITSIEFIEYAHLMESNASTAKWGWMSQTNTPWHAIAFALSELCVRPASPLTDRAWQAVSTVYKELDLNSKQKKGMLWRPLSGLMKRAAAFRAEQLGQMQTQPGNGKVPEQPVSANPQESALAQPIPQITPTPQAAITQPAEAFGTDGALDFDISKGPIGILADMFPDTDLLSDSNAFDTSIPQPPFASAGAPINMPQAGMTSTDQTMLMPNAQLNWDDWDQVMRDFQMDVQNTEAAHRMDSTSDWLA